MYKNNFFAECLTEARPCFLLGVLLTGCAVYRWDRQTCGSDENDVEVQCPAVAKEPFVSVKVHTSWEGREDKCSVVEERLCEIFKLTTIVDTCTVVIREEGCRKTAKGKEQVR